ncbi:MAG: hypothetical protein M1470_08490 [Bacteroidetes bacterium]|nr:hypothetical protein [Bacteroidota bacterium]MCL5737386.1 hypothetical protein [Bacteroidota bacterium]
MGINSIDQGSVATQVAATPSKGAQIPTQSTSSASGPKKDNAVISQKAKDLAALRAGKSFTEEANESFSVKEQEAQGS